MTDEKTTTPPLDWQALAEKERLVWAASFVAAERAGADGTAEADTMVCKLRAGDSQAEPKVEAKAEASNEAALRPVYEALSVGVWMSDDVFFSWYRMAYRIAMRCPHDPHRPTDEEIALARKVFDMGRADFY